MSPKALYLVLYLSVDEFTSFILSTVTIYCVTEVKGILSCIIQSATEFTGLILSIIQSLTEFTDLRVHNILCILYRITNYAGGVTSYTYLLQWYKSVTQSTFFLTKNICIKKYKNGLHIQYVCLKSSSLRSRDCRLSHSV